MKYWRGAKIDPVLRELLLSPGLPCYELKCWVQRLQAQSSLWALPGTPPHSCFHQTSHPYCTAPVELSRVLSTELGTPDVEDVLASSSSRDAPNFCASGLVTRC